MNGLKIFNYTEFSGTKHVAVVKESSIKTYNNVYRTITFGKSGVDYFLTPDLPSALKIVEILNS